MLDMTHDTTRLVRVLVVRPSGRTEAFAIEPRVEDVRELVGAPVLPLPVDLAERLVLYVADGGTHEVNVQASRAFGGSLSGSVVLAALRSSGGLTDLTEADVRSWSERVARA